MAITAATNILSSGIDITTPSVSAASSQTFANDGKKMLLIKNGNAGTIVATFVTQKTQTDGSAAVLAIPDRTVSITTGKYYLAGPFSPDLYNDASGEVTVSLDVTSSVLIQALNFTPAAF